MDLLVVLLTSFLGLVAGLITAWFGARFAYRRKLQELRFQATHEARRTAYEATLQWVRAASLASRLQAEQARHGGTGGVDYDNWPQPPAELWDLYVSDKVKDRHHEFLTAAALVHTSAGRLGATRETVERASSLDHPDQAKLAAMVAVRDSLDAELASGLARLDEAQSALLDEMRADVIGDH